MFHLYQRLWPGYKSFSASSGLYGSSEPWVGGEPGDFRVTVLDFNRSMWLHIGNPWKMSLIVSGAGCTVLICRGVELDNPIHLSSKVCWWMKQTENAYGWRTECQGREEAYVFPKSTSREFSLRSVWAGVPHGHRGGWPMWVEFTGVCFVTCEKRRSSGLGLFHFKFCYAVQNLSSEYCFI